MTGDGLIQRFHQMLSGALEQNAGTRRPLATCPTIDLCTQHCLSQFCHTGGVSRQTTQCTPLVHVLTRVGLESRAMLYRRLCDRRNAFLKPVTPKYQFVCVFRIKATIRLSNVSMSSLEQWRTPTHIAQAPRQKSVSVPCQQIFWTATCMIERPLTCHYNREILKKSEKNLRHPRQRQ